ncbi:uncharacterized protein LOC118335412 [Morone saxatilis]|uniref:uncharacterized protein LOC118335412 n=1 Tax=Morone saxatilis TaxID=34816 RepID=UPI0015E24B98|nr:uncharacterized protein LOC118335412 [Morone saxatilis]
MEDGPNRMDNTEPTGMETTNEQRILRSCSCRWSNMTTYRGLRIHQGKAKCGGKDQGQTCTAQAGQTRRSQSQFEHHSVADFTVADGHREVEQPYQQQAQSQQQAHSPERECHTETPSSNPTRQARERPTRQTKVKWPKSIEKAAWESFDQDLHSILENSLRGSTITKLNLFGSIVYGEGKETFGEVIQRKNIPREVGRREQEIYKLVKERRLLKRSCRKADENEKEGLKVLWDQIRSRLATLRRAERIRKRRNKKEKERVSFFRDPFRYARSLLEEKKCGRLEATEQELEENIKNQLTDQKKNIPLGSPGHVPRPAEPAVEFNTTPPKWTEVKLVVDRKGKYSFL